MKNLIYAALCFILVMALLSWQPGDTGDLTSVNDELQQQAEDAGLLNVQMPAGAESTTYNGLEQDGALVGEVYFKLNGVLWCYRCAAGDADTDLSGMDGDFADVTEVQLQGRDGVVYCNAGETGKILWSDPEAGLVYSLTMASDADASKLQSIANYMFTP